MPNGISSWNILLARVIRSTRKNDIAKLSCDPASFCVVAATGKTYSFRGHRGWLWHACCPVTRVEHILEDTVTLIFNGQHAVRSSGAFCIRHISCGVVVSVRDTSDFLEHVTVLCWILRRPRARPHSINSAIDVRFGKPNYPSKNVSFICLISSSVFRMYPPRKLIICGGPVCQPSQKKSICLVSHFQLHLLDRYSRQP